MIRDLAFSRRLAGVAAQLLGAKRLRLYQDCVFCKEPGFSETNWHSDASLAPLDTNAFVTAWIPLRPIMVRTHCIVFCFLLGLSNNPVPSGLCDYIVSGQMG